MSSYIMHLCISNKVKEKLNLTDKFLYGSILPDVIKEITGDRVGTHYLKETLLNNEVRKLPQIQKAISELDIQDKEIRLGYIAHLIEDYIWFTEYIPRFTKKVSNDQIKYLKDGTIHSMDEYRDNIYFDYANSNRYVIESNNVDLEKVKNSIINIMTDEKQKEVFTKNIKCLETSNISLNTFMTKENIDEYIEKSEKQVEEKILELLGD